MEKIMMAVEEAEGAEEEAVEMTGEEEAEDEGAEEVNLKTMKNPKEKILKSLNQMLHLRRNYL